MAQRFQKKEEKLIASFEDSIKSLSNKLFEMHTYEKIIKYYMDREDHSKALIAVDQAIYLYPFSDELIPLKAQILLSLKRHEEAFDLLEKARYIYPNNVDIYLTLGEAFSEQGKHEEALSLYNETLSFAEDQIDEILYHIGLTHQLLKNYKKAIEAYKKAIAINRHHDAAFYELTYCLDIEGALKDHLPYYKKFTDRHPYSSDAWYHLGVVYDKLKNYEQALVAYDYAITIEETFSNALFNMGHTYLQLKQEKKALECFQKTVDLEGASSEVYCAIGTAHANLGHHKISLQYFKKSIDLDPTCDEAWNGIGTCLASQEKWYQALCFFNKAIKLNNQHAGYWKAAADSEMKMGNILSSLKAYERASLMDPENLETWLDWSSVYHKYGDMKKAIAILKAGLAEIPNAPDLLYRLVVYFTEKGDYKSACTHLEKALALNFKGHDVLFQFFPKTKTQKELLDLINKFKKENF